MPFTFDSLPKELIYIIFNYFTLKERIRLERVSKKWSQVLKSSYLTQNTLSIINGWSLGQYKGCNGHKQGGKSGVFSFRNIWNDSTGINRV